MKYIFTLMCLLLIFYCLAQKNGISNRSSKESIFLSSNRMFSGSTIWEMRRFDSVPADGSIISTKAFRENNWMNATVPGTALTTLINNHIYPDPYFGDVNKRNHFLIPDIADVGNSFYHYWYRSSFKVPTNFTNNRLWLKFNGVNYRATIWLNGKKLGIIAGMFNGKSFDITNVVDRRGFNILAVNIAPVDIPGQSGLKNEKRNGAHGENNNGGDGLIGENVTMLMSAGWDFTFPDGVRDRNTGMWKEVELYATGDVILAHPFVVSSLPLPDTTSSKESISVDVTNVSPEKQTGILRASIKDVGIGIERRITLDPHETRKIVFTPKQYPQLNIQHPSLWWPINKGPQNLYHLDLTFTQQKNISHSIQSEFGIREIRSDQNTPDSSRRFLVNGCPVFIRGANWIPESMLRNSAKRTYAELLYTHQAGINMLRLWGGGIPESDYFFHLCDSLGIMVWTEYWMTGDTRYPNDKQLYLDNLKNTVLRIRNHPSLAYYVSSNESTEIQGAAALIHTLDSTRGYQMQSECCGVHDGSPYKYVNPMRYFENTASERGSRINGFNPEYGAPCLPVYESLKKMMPKKDLWPINDSVWNYMDGGGFHLMTTKYKEAVNQIGTSNSIQEFTQKAQIVGAMNYRSIWEVWNFNKFNYGNRFASGFFFWYHNSPIPQVCSRLYDWYLQPTAALYYSQNGLAPLHVQFDYLTNKVSVYNDYRQEFKHYKVIAEVFDYNSKKVWAHKVYTDIPSDGVVNDLFEIAFPKNISQVHFINLVLESSEGKKVASSFYWRSKDKYEGAMTMTGPAVSGFGKMSTLPVADLHVQKQNKGDKIYVTIKNVSAHLAFFTQVQLQTIDDEGICPAFYSDNFFNLLPGESKSLEISYFKEDANGKPIQLMLHGFNTKKQIVKL